MWEIFIPKGLETGHGECKRGTTLKNFLDKLIRKKKSRNTSSDSKFLWCKWLQAGLGGYTCRQALRGRMQVRKAFGLVQWSSSYVLFVLFLLKHYTAFTFVVTYIISPNLIDFFFLKGLEVQN